MLGDLANSQPRTEATGRSAGGILHPVPPVPMVLQVCFRSPDCEAVSVTPLTAALPCSKSAPARPLFVDMLWKTQPNTLSTLSYIFYESVGVWLHVHLTPA